MEQLRADLCVIGAGSGGLSVAAGAVQMGASVVLIEGHRMGGDCLNFGCVPSKALLAAAKRAHARGTPPAGADYAAAMEHVAAAIAAIAPQDSEERFVALGCRVIRAWARFVAPDAVEAGGLRIAARRFVIATGSVPTLPPIPGLDAVPVLTNETLFDLRARPGHLLVIGAGPIGLEMAQAHVRLGSRVTVIEAARPLPREDRELAAPVLARLRAEGVVLLEGVGVAAVSGAPEDIRLDLSDGRTVSGTHLLVATGRRPALDRLDLARASIAHDARGVRVDAGLRSVSNRRVFAVGDAAGGGQFTHLAAYHAGIVIRRALFGLPARARTDHIPRATYTDPEIAWVGPSEDEARRRHGPGLEILRWPFAENDRAIAEGETAGLVKVLAARGRPVAAGIVGPHAGELIAPFALALAAGLRLSALAAAVLPYPTRSEAGKRAAGAYFSPRLFGNPRLKRVVRAVQRFLP